jgi:hypothetical protein
VPAEADSSVTWALLKAILQLPASFEGMGLENVAFLGHRDLERAAAAEAAAGIRSKLCSVTLLCAVNGSHGQDPSFLSTVLARSWLQM